MLILKLFCSDNINGMVLDCAGAEITTFNANPGVEACPRF
jgi:hypothetical protein